MVPQVNGKQATKIVSRKSRRKNKKNRNFKKSNIIAIVVAVLLIPFLFKNVGQTLGLCIRMREYNNENLIYPNVFIEGTHIGGENKQSALKMLSNNYKIKDKKRDIVIKVDGKEYKINFSNLKIDYDFKQAIDEAFAYGRNESFNIKLSMFKGKTKRNIKLKYKYDNSILNDTIKKIESEVNVTPKDAILKIGPSGQFTVEEEEIGRKLLSDNIKKDIKNNMNIIGTTDIVIQGKMKEITPSRKKKDLVKVNSIISTYTTRFNMGNENRCTNIKLASSSIGGTVVMPGENFSFNDVVGERTSQKGYKAAKVIINEKFVDDLGGGICQVSSTLYNAVMRANIMATERMHHTIPSSYVPLGMDATVDYGNIDYKFQNTLNYPIYIQSIMGNGALTFNIYSNDSLKNRRYDLINEIHGNKVNVYKVTYENGRLIDKSLINIDVYSKKE